MGKNRQRHNTRKQQAGAGAKGGTDSTAGSNNPIVGSGSSSGGGASRSSASTNAAAGPSSSPQQQQQQQQQQQKEQEKQPADAPDPTEEGGSGRTYETLWDWIHAEREGLFWVLGCASIGFVLGFGVGCGWFTGGSGSFAFVESETSKRRAEGVIDMRRKYIPAPWRAALASRIRRTALYEVSTFRKAPWTPLAEFAFGYGGADDCSGKGGGPGGGWMTPPKSHPLENAPADSSRHDSLPGSSFSTDTTPIPGMAAAPPMKAVPPGNVFTRSVLWPPNWILFREIDVAHIHIDVDDGGLSPFMVSFLSFLLPWRRPLIQALGRKSTGGTSSADGLFPPGSSAPVDRESHPLAFQALREHVIRLDGGYVHPDLGFLVPAPSGAERGLGMVRDTYTTCQRRCYVGSLDEVRINRVIAQKEEAGRARQDFERKRILKLVKTKFPHLMDGGVAATATQRPLTPMAEGERLADALEELPEENNQWNILLQKQGFGGESIGPSNSDGFNVTNFEEIMDALKRQSDMDPKYTQEEVLLTIPLDGQMTRGTALMTLEAAIPVDLKRRSPLLELDDSALLAMLLAHERGIGPDSRWWPYVATLPKVPSCAFNPARRQAVVDVVTAAGVQMGADVQGWPSELSKAAEYAERIAVSLSRDYGSYLGRAATGGGNGGGGGGGNGNGAAGVTMDSMRWALCQVASRAVAGRDHHGSLRLVPVMDMINHDAAAGKFVELTGKETIDGDDFIDATEDDSGAFVVRSMRHGKRKPLRKGQELLANYNVPAYSPLDWFLNMGYIPPERGGRWTMLEAALPRVRKGGFSREMPTVKSTGAFGSGKPEIQVIRQRLIP